jgi:gamma-glutamylaminecyclotransferase
MPLETVFVYGSLKRGFVNHHVMTGTKFLGTGITQPGFAMIDLGRYPGVIQGTAVIAGEVFAAPTPLMGRLDRLEDNGRVYRREVTSIHLPSGTVNAWIYLYLLARGHEKPVRPRGGVVTWREPPALHE